jgi:methylated-DNA-[protein]-cysteine S-methyltransferase
MIDFCAIEKDTPLYMSKLDSPMGQWKLVWCDKGLVHSTMDRSCTSFQKGQTVAPPEWLKEAWENFWLGEKFTLNLCFLKEPSSFAMSVYRIVAAIPPGKTKSYKDVAAGTGNPRAARAIGSVMRKNPWAPFVPCHRVIGSDGNMCGYGGSGGVELKAAFLEYEKSF